MLIWEDRGMPWLAPFENAPDTHRMWADPGSSLEAALRASGFDTVVSGPGFDLPDEEPPAEPVPAVQKTPVEKKPRRITRRKP